MHARRGCAALLAGLLAVLVVPASAFACSRDDTAYFDGFIDSSCLLAPLNATTIDTFGGLRLTTNGTPETTSWDTDTELEDGVTYQGSPFGPVDVSTLAVLGAGNAGELQLPATPLPLTPDAAGSVLGPTASEQLDSDGVDDPTVARVGSGYVMWYSGTAEDGSGPAIFTATSPDGRQWARANGGDPVLTGTSGAFDEHGVSGPDVVYDASAAPPYRMYYAGRGAVFGAIGMATSSDGVTWTKHDDDATPAPTDAVLEHGEAGSADSFAAADPSVIRDGATWKLWYTGDDSSKKRIAYATSPDGVAWTKGGKVIAPEDPGANANYSFGAFAPSVFKLADDSYRMLLTGRKLVSGTTFQTKIMDATSQDGIEWTAPSPALNPSGTSTKFDFSNLNAPDVLADPADGGARFKLYYAGNTVDANGNFHTRIGYATSQSGGSFSKVTSGAGVHPDDSVLDIGTLSERFDARQASGLSVTLPASATPKYVGFYWGARGSDFKPRLGVATSPDGSAWSKVAGAQADGSLLPLGNNAAFDNGGQRDPSVLYDAAAYELYFTALNASGVRSIGHASTPELLAGHQPDHGAWSAAARVLQADGSGFDADGVAHPSVVKDGSSYVAYYTGYGAGTTAIGRASSSSASLTSPTRGASPVLAAGAAGSFDAAGVKDPVVIRLGASDYRMIYTGLETAADGRTIERLGYATSSDGTSWSKQGLVQNPSLAAYAADEVGVEATGLVDDSAGATLHVFTSGVDRTGRTRGGHATTALPTVAGAIPSGWATYRLGGPDTTVRDFRAITRTSSGDGVTLWMSFLQPYSSAGSEFWSDPFPVTVDSATEALRFLLTVRGVRWQARLAGPDGYRALDRVDITHAPVSFTPAGGATTTNITPPSGQATTRWGDLTVESSLFSPTGGGSGGGTVTVRDAGSGAALASQTLNTSGTTTIPLAGIAAAAHPALRVGFALTSVGGAATPLVQSLKVLYNAAAPPPPPPPAPALTLTAAPTTIVFGQQATLSGQLTRAGAPLAGAAVALLAQPAGAAAFAPLASAVTGTAGTYASTVTPSATTSYRASFPGVATQPTAQVAVEHLVRLKVRRSGRRGRFSGSIGPVHADKPVVIEQLKRGAWAPLTTVTTTSTSTFALARKLKACKRYRFRATTAADAAHLAGVSATVRVAPHRVTLKLARKGRRVTFTGKVRPPHPGKTLVLRVRRGTSFARFAKVRISKRSTFKLARRLKPGGYSFRAELPRDRCHFAGKSRVRSVTVP
jgi:predicted GH43/DUF377 family glycosyl hydrolase